MRPNSTTETTNNWQSQLPLLSEALSDLHHVADNELNETESPEFSESFSRMVQLSSQENPWFSRPQIAGAIRGLAHMLRADAVEVWAKKYGGLPKKYTGKRVGIIAAGNIPMVGFHDVLCTMVAGHLPVVKLSGQDRRLLPAVFAHFEGVLGTPLDVEWTEERLGPVDAVIATGSNNTARYFEYYFGDKPHIIRKNRNSVAILTGDESPDALEKLGEDIFSYFGLGCRNVAKIYIPEDYDIDRFFKAIYPYHEVVNHHKYANNYDYYKALWLLNREDLLDNGFILLRPTKAIASPPGVLYYERYTDANALRHALAEKQAEIQCIVSSGDVPFGKSQQPELWDYADGVDTMEFLQKL